MISKRTLTAWQRFNDDLAVYAIETGENPATLYEDANTTRCVKDFKMTEAGELTWIEEDRNGVQRQEQEQMLYAEEASEYLAYWRGCLRRAKRYWATDAETLDKIQDGEIQDENED